MSDILREKESCLSISSNNACKKRLFPWTFSVSLVALIIYANTFDTVYPPRYFHTGNIEEPGHQNDR